MTTVYPSNVPPGKKHCHKCDRTLDIECFGRNRGRKDGHGTECQECRKKYREQPHVRERDRESAKRQWKRLSQSEEGRALNRKACRTYYNKYKEKILHKQSITYALNIEEEHEYRRQYRKQNPQLSMNRRAKEKVRPGKNITKGELQFIRERDTICYICGKPIGDYPTHFDHVIPVDRGGEHKAENLKLTHAVCNTRKRTRLLAEMTPFQRRGPDC